MAEFSNDSAVYFRCLVAYYILFLYYHGFYPILDQESLKLMNTHFSKRNLEIRYEDIQETWVLRKLHKPFVRFLMVRVVCKDGRHMMQAC